MLTMVAKLNGTGSFIDSVFFGWTVAVEGNFLLVGSPRKGGDDFGSVSLFVRRENLSTPDWLLVKKYYSENPIRDFSGVSFDEYGISVAISEDKFVIGAHRDDDKAIDAGAVYMFRSHAFENSAATLDNSGDLFLPSLNEDEHDNEGILVSNIIASLGGNWIVDADGDVPGIAIVDVNEENGNWQFKFPGDNYWREFETFTPGSEIGSMVFAPDVSLRFVPDNDFFGTVPAGITFRAWDQSSTHDYPYIVDTSVNGGSTSFSAQTETASIEVNAVNDAPRIDVNQHILVNDQDVLTIEDIHLHATDVEGETPDMITYIVTRAPGKGVLQRESLALSTNDIFTQSDIDNQLISIATPSGAIGQDSFEFVMKDSLGAMSDPIEFLFTVSFSLHSRLTDVGNDNSQFGFALAMDGDLMVVGSPHDEGNLVGSGAAYLYKRTSAMPDEWTLLSKLVADDGATDDTFGYSVAISGSTVVIGAPLDWDNGTRSGSAYVFDQSQGGGENWEQVAKLTEITGSVEDRYGHAVAIDGGTIVVGVIEDDKFGVSSGASFTELTTILADSISALKGDDPPPEFTLANWRFTPDD